MSLREELDEESRAHAMVEARTRSLKDRIASQDKELEELRAFVGFYTQARDAGLEPPTWMVQPASAARHAGIVVAQLTDLHFDEVVKPEEVLFLNAYNRQIAEVRFQRWAEKTIELPRDYFAGVAIEGLFIPATGDIFSGDIHHELKESNADHLLSSLVFWMERMIAALELLEREYGNVTVGAVVGNHGRTTIKPVFKGRAHSNVEWLFWSVVQARLVDRGSKVQVIVSDSMDLNIPVYGRNHLLTHGDQFKGGTGISGAFAPLMLGTHRKGQRQAVAEMPMDLMVIGHMHQYLDLPGVIMGGSMKGYDEYAFGLNLRPEQARQALWLTTPERGKTMTMPIELQRREAEGW
jgi:hypothetical protein